MGERSEQSFLERARRWRRVLTIGQKAAVLSDISAWNAVFEALMAAGVTVETEFLERLDGEANQ
jgi:hypothetical protein